METAQNSGRCILTDCIFCHLDEERIINKTTSYLVIRDLFPVCDLHTLIIPKRHLETYFDLNDAELNELPDILRGQRDRILERDGTITGFNISINSGKDAGQTISHCHIHLIPRRKRDVPDPRGSVREVIPNKQQY